MRVPFSSNGTKYAKSVLPIEADSLIVEQALERQWTLGVPLAGHHVDAYLSLKKDTLRIAEESAGCTSLSRAVICGQR